MVLEENKHCAAEVKCRALYNFYAHTRRYTSNSWLHFIINTLEELVSFQLPKSKGEEMLKCPHCKSEISLLIPPKNIPPFGKGIYFFCSHCNIRLMPTLSSFLILFGGFILITSSLIGISGKLFYNNDLVIVFLIFMTIGGWTCIWFNRVLKLTK